ncbi:MAG: dethiobiotin synthase [Bacteroidota bacterium]
MHAPAYFVSGIGTEVGKTVMSAILVKSLHADYWKPVQCGDLDYTDSHKVAEWTGATSDRIHRERHRLQMPASPHLAAERENLRINLSDFELPKTDRPLIVEGAGGLLVPLNDQHTMLDLIAHLGIPVLLVSRHYLGSINHTLMSIEMLRQRDLAIAGLIYSGDDQGKDTVDIIQKMTGIEPMLEVGELNDVSFSGLPQVETFPESFDPRMRS